MTVVGRRELRQDAAAIVRRVEGGERIDITTAGRLVAQLVPVAPRQWLRWEDIADLFHGPADPDWERIHVMASQDVDEP